MIRYFIVILLLCSATVAWSQEPPAPAPAEELVFPPIPAPPEPLPYAPKSVIVHERSLTQSDKDNIERIAPWQPIVPPKKERKLLVFGLNMDYGGHRSIVHANYAFTLMGQRTKAFTAIVTNDPSAFCEDGLKEIDAVVFNNNVGNIFTNPFLRQTLENYVRNGGGLLALHGATMAFVHWDGEQKGHDDWPIFGEMIGARGMEHRESDERLFIRIDDPDHPLTQCFPKDGFEYREEFLRVADPFSRQNSRVLLSIDNARSNLNRVPYGDRKERPDEDYALAWVKTFGNGRCCYVSFGHNSRVFWDPMMLQFYLGAIQFVLGDLEAPTEPR